MKIGDIVMTAPTYDSLSGLESVKPQPAKVVAVNEAHRFYTVEFVVNGYRFRESFHMKPKG